MVNKIDRADARAQEVLDETYDLFIDLDATEEQLDFPVLYCNARAVWRAPTPEGEGGNLRPLFDEILKTVPCPGYDSEKPLQFLVTSLDYDDYVGRLAIGRIFNGQVRKGQDATLCLLDGTNRPIKVTQLYGYDGLDRVEIDQADPGDIVAIAGLDEVAIGETISDPENPMALPPILVDEPTLAMVFSTNTSPMAGKEGTHVTSNKLRERLLKESLTNVAIRVEETPGSDALQVSGRGELQLAILIETIRREGFEFSVGKPQVIVRPGADGPEEPIEMLTIDCPEEFVGAVTQKLGPRKGRMLEDGQPRHRPGTNRVPDSGPRVDRLSYRVSDRDPGNRHHEPPVRLLRPLAGRDTPADHRRPGSRSNRPRHRLCRRPSATAWNLLPGTGGRGL